MPHMAYFSCGNMIISVLLILGLSLSSSATVMLYVRPQDLKPEDVLCNDSSEENGHCRLYLKICVHVDSEHCAYLTSSNYGQGQQWKILNESALECRSIDGICIPIQFAPSTEYLLHVRLHISVHTDPSTRPYMEHYFMFNIADRSTYFNWRTAAVRTEVLRTRFTVSLMFSCGGNTYGHLCRGTCGAPSRIYHSCQRGNAKYCYLRPVFNISCTPECSDYLTCSFPHEIHFVPPAKATTIDSPRLQSGTTQKGDESRSLGERVGNSEGSSELGQAVRITCYILIPILVIGVAASPCILYYCRPRREKRPERTWCRTGREWEREERWPGRLQLEEASERDMQQKEDDHEGTMV